MKGAFTLTLDGTDYRIEVHGDTIMVEGRPFEVNIEGNGRVTVDGIAYDAVLEGDKAIVDGIAYRVAVAGLMEETAAPRVAVVPPKAAVGTGAIQAIMPGKVVQVLVSEGDQVAEGDVVLILEAMKMENELRAPRGGVVKALYAQPGQDVEANTVLAEIGTQ